MTHSFLRAAGTLAVALTLLAGCDSADPSASADRALASTVMVSATCATPTTSYLTLTVGQLIKVSGSTSAGSSVTTVGVDLQVSESGGPWTTFYTNNGSAILANSNSTLFAAPAEDQDHAYAGGAPRPGRVPVRYRSVYTCDGATTSPSEPTPTVYATPVL